MLMYEFRCDYVKANYGEKAKLCYMDTESFVIYIKTDDTYKDTKICNKNMLKLDRPLPKGKNKTTFSPGTLSENPHLEP